MTEAFQTTHVVNSDGTPRSGKDTCAEDLGRRYGLQVIEAGRLHRFYTRQMLEVGLITSEMLPENITAIAQERDPVEVAASLHEVPSYIDKHGLDALYTPEIDAAVGLVAKAKLSQQVVPTHIKGQIRERVGAGDEVIITVGRGLASVAREAGANVLLDTFLTCSARTAAVRQCRRLGIAGDSPEAQKIYSDLQCRMQEDAARPDNPVIPQENAADFNKLREEGLTPKQIGNLAACNGVQIIVETDDMGLEPMKANFNLMYEGAMAAVGRRVLSVV